MEDLVKGISNEISKFKASLSHHLPAIEADVNRIIKRQSQDKRSIEYYLDTLLSLATIGVGETVFINLLEYYKTLDAEGGAFYWEEYSREEE